jgi:hypothetical protein
MVLTKVKTRAEYLDAGLFYCCGIWVEFSYWLHSRIGLNLTHPYGVLTVFSIRDIIDTVMAVMVVKAC